MRASSFILAPVLLGLSLTAWSPASAAELQPELLFKDTFDVSEPSSDVNFENASRQSGLLAPLIYNDLLSSAQVGQADAPGMLRLPSSTYVSPNHNFVEGGKFSLEFDLDPGIDDDPTDGLSGDWCAVVLGASSQDVWVNSSDGLGILFRNDGRIEVWETGGQGAIYSGPGEVAIPTDKPFRVRLEVDAPNFKGSPATVKMFIDGQQTRLDFNSLEHVKATGFRNNYITLEGLGFPGPWVHVVDNLAISAVPWITVAPQSASAVKGSAGDEVTVSVPAQVVAGGPAQVTVRSLKPAIAKPTGGDANGVLKLTFTGAALSQTFTVTGVHAGATTLVVEGPAGVSVNGGVAVVIASGIGLAQDLFTDNFETSSSSYDVNFEAGAPRQGGTAAPLMYTEDADSAAGGAADDATQINSPDAPGKLLTIGRGLSPDHNFIEGAQFTIETVVETGINNPGRDSADWAAIVFGTTAPNSFVISADGFGILFRNDGRVEAWDAGNRVYGSSLAEALPAGPLAVRIEAKAASFSGAPATISLFVNDQPTKIAPDTLSYIKADGFRNNHLTLYGYGTALQSTFDDLKVSAKAGFIFLTRRIDTAAGQTVEVGVQAPSALIAGADAQVRVVSHAPGVASPAGAVNGVLTLTFAKGGPVVQTFNLNVKQKGYALLELENDQNVAVGDPLPVFVPVALVRNPSFESNYNPGWPHYSAIDDWGTAGGQGVNEDGAGPFADSGAVPDGNRVAFLQGSTTISQQISGLTPGKPYWVQFRYNARGCCGGTVDLTTRFDDADLDTLTNLKAVGGQNAYGFRNVLFTPAADSGVLTFASTANGDATAVLDAITIVQRDEGNVIVQNPSFEASGRLAGDGRLGSFNLGGWDAAGTYGVNFSGAGPFADNGTAPDQDDVAFLAGPGSLSQVVPRLVAGKPYTLSFAYNAALDTQPHLQVKVSNAVLFEENVSPVGGSAAYRTKSLTFVASDTSARITFAQTRDGADALLLDDVRLVGESISLPCLGVAPAKVVLGVGQTASIALTVPPQLIAAAPATIKVRSANVAVAKLPGAGGDGVLAVTFAAGGATTQTFDLLGVGRGDTAVEVVDSATLCVDNGVAVSVVTSFVRNPSFESNPAGNFPGYGQIDAWTGGSGLNRANGPFHDNGVIPDRLQIAFLQVNQTLAQELIGLTPGKQYWLQFFYNARNCCGGSIDLTVRYAGAELTTITGVTAVGGNSAYNFANLAFTPTEGAGMLEFVSTAAGDATVLLDAVCIVQRDEGEIVVANPSFEADGLPAWPGYIQPAHLAGWAATGNYGVNVSGPGPFADNGTNPDQDSVAFVQGVASLSQTVSGLTAGKAYTLSFAVNARSGPAPQLQVSVGGQVLLDEAISPQGGAAPYLRKQVVFTADSDTTTVSLAQVGGGDVTLLFDDVHITGGGVAPPPKVSLAIQRSGASDVALSWPAAAPDFVLQSANAVTGGWTDVLAPAVVQGDRLVVTLPATAKAKFYRLRK